MLVRTTQCRNSPTNSTGKTEHFFAIVTFLSGADTTALDVICRVWLNHHKLVSLRTWRLKQHAEHKTIGHKAKSTPLLTSMYQFSILNEKFFNKWHFCFPILETIQHITSITQHKRYLAFEWNGGENSIKRTLPISRDQNKIISTVVYISYLQYLYDWSHFHPNQ